MLPSPHFALLLTSSGAAPLPAKQLSIRANHWNHSDVPSKLHALPPQQQFPSLETRSLRHPLVTTLLAWLSIFHQLLPPQCQLSLKSTRNFNFSQNAIPLKRMMSFCPNSENGGCPTTVVPHCRSLPLQSHVDTAFYHNAYGHSIQFANQQHLLLSSNLNRSFNVVEP